MLQKITTERIKGKIQRIFYASEEYFLKIPTIKMAKINTSLLLLKHRIKLHLKKQVDLKIIIGASGSRQKGWLPSNQYVLDLLKEDDWQKLFNKNSIDAILAEHVWEHLTNEEGFDALKRCFAYLKKGGYLRLAVPDAFSPDKNYTDLVKPGGSGKGSKDHKSFYNYIDLSRSIEDAGFMAKPLEYFNEKGVFIYNDWKSENGFISRSRYNDERNDKNKIIYTSLIIDAIKTE